MSYNNECEGLRKDTYVAAAVQDDPDDLALLDLRQLQLRKSLASIHIVLKTKFSPEIQHDTMD